MCGSATLATLVSSTSMKVASMTVMAMIHGLTPRCQSIMGEAASGGFSRMAVSAGVERLHLAGGVGQIGARLVVAVERGDLVIVGAGQLVLRGDDFNVVGDAGLETVACLFDLLFGEGDSERGDVDLTARRFELRGGGLDFERDAVAEFLLLLLELANGEIGFVAGGLDAAAGKERDVHVELVLIDGDDAGGGQSTDVGKLRNQRVCQREAKKISLR